MHFRKRVMRFCYLATSSHIFWKKSRTSCTSEKSTSLGEEEGSWQQISKTLSWKDLMWFVEAKNGFMSSCSSACLLNVTVCISFWALHGEIIHCSAISVSQRHFTAIWMGSNPPASCNQHTAWLHSWQPRSEHQKQNPSKEESARDLHVKTGEGTIKPEGWWVYTRG